MYLLQFKKALSLDLIFSLLGKVHKSVFDCLRHIEELFPLLLAHLLLTEITIKRLLILTVPTHLVPIKVCPRCMKWE